jgi:hypothetical protein
MKTKILLTFVAAVLCLLPSSLRAEAAATPAIRASYAGPVKFATDKMTVPVGK